ncbi:MAG: tRNA (guanosine(37)-N1)-methyltransferase TrmD [Gemmataceae bacterium]|nr:tRNA (guanosine(37)-N1)-methyltransferase TrmD [Gemmataceae bacterium]MCS7269533.1 tRNA (guanosine(37)-N1)-methyltransferase TrmD [Gemmataceae bacterium]MDW8243933.1 tRNA (guanosine(37)-N1)-methyltransferase TrmD [Thermogemmata sp.]
MIRFDVLTLFPGIFDGFLQHSLLAHAIQAGLVQVHRWNIRDWSQDKHHKVDDHPFGGGPGMVLMAPPVVECVEAVQGCADPPGRVILLTPAGERLTQPLVRRLAKEPRLLLICGRYEGFDERIRDILQPWEISIGDYVCNGGEVPAMVIIDCIIRLIPGVLGDTRSLQEESHNVPGEVEYPQYTRPRVYRGRAVPEVLLSGNHAAIAAWRREQARLRSLQRLQRPSLIHQPLGDHPANAPVDTQAVITPSSEK